MHMYIMYNYVNTPDQSVTNIARITCIHTYIHST